LISLLKLTISLEEILTEPVKSKKLEEKLMQQFTRALDLIKDKVLQRVQSKLLHQISKKQSKNLNSTKETQIKVRQITIKMISLQLGKEELHNLLKNTSQVEVHSAIKVEVQRDIDDTNDK
jgi:hypothetical protein